MIPIKFLLILSFSILLIFQLGVLGISLISSSYFKFRKVYLFWGLSITLSCLGYIFGLAEILSSVQLSKLSFLVTLATLCFGISQAILIWVLQALDHKQTSRKLIYFLLFITCAYVLLFEYGRIFEDFIFRGVLTSTFYSLSSLLELYILWRLKQVSDSSWSGQLYFPAFAIICNLSISLFRVIYLLNPGMSELPFGIGVSVIIFAIAQVFFTLIFVGVSYYWVEEIGVSNRTLVKESKEYQALMSSKEKTLNQLLLSQKSTMLGAYAHLVAHEVNQPLATLQMNADFLKELLLSKTELVKERSLLDSMIIEILRAASIIRSIKGLLTKEKIGPSFFSLDELAKEVTETLRLKILANNIELNLKLNTPTFIFADKYELQLVLMNLVENAIFAISSTAKSVSTNIPMSASNEHHVQGQITLVTELESEHVVLKVIDNGPGVSQEYRKTLFELHSSSKEDGTGMGLWLCSFIAKRHNGKLIYEDAYIKGASFSLRLPHVRQSEGLLLS